MLLPSWGARVCWGLVDRRAIRLGLAVLMASSRPNGARFMLGGVGGSSARRSASVSTSRLLWVSFYGLYLPLWAVAVGDSGRVRR
jgi:hypothetical protein